MHRKDKLSLLKGLGDTPYGIFESLKERGIKGRINSRRDCPLANYIKSVDPSATPDVDPNRIAWGGNVFNLDDPQLNDLSYFISRFDQHMFPVLIDNKD